MIWATAPRVRETESQALAGSDWNSLSRLFWCSGLLPRRIVVRDHEADGEGGKQGGGKEKEKKRKRWWRARRGVKRGPYHRGPSNRLTGCPGLRPLSLRQFCLARGKYVGQGHRGGIGGLYYIYEALSKQSNNIDSAPRSDRPSRRTPSHGPPLGYVYTLPEGLRRPYSFDSCVLLTPRLFYFVRLSL